MRGVGFRCSLGPVWLWHGPAAVALIQSLNWEPPYPVGMALKKTLSIFLRLVSKVNRYKNKQMRPNQTYKLLYSEENYKQNKKTT